jgi:hypothetical protein|tara:strand:+ start:1337 stop:1471 length:135 start_codon:yes stop_codon:yes gene_type:complete
MNPDITSTSQDMALQRYRRMAVITLTAVYFLILADSSPTAPVTG